MASLFASNVQVPSVLDSLHEDKETGGWSIDHVHISILNIAIITLFLFGLSSITHILVQKTFKSVGPLISFFIKFVVFFELWIMVRPMIINAYESGQLSSIFQQYFPESLQLRVIQLGRTFLHKMQQPIDVDNLNQ